MKRAGGSECSEFTLFDIYKGAQIAEGYKSVAFSFKISSHDKTLTDEEIQTVVNKIVNALKSKFNAQLRL